MASPVDTVTAYHFPPSIKIHDTTLRDGEQQASIIFTRDDKLAIAELLDQMGVHRIEAGMPAVSKDDRDAIGQIAKRVKRSDVFCFVRSRRDDIDMAVQCGAKGVCVEIVVNEAMAAQIFGWDRRRTLDMILDACRFAHEQGLFVSAFMMDMSRGDPAWVKEFARTLDGAGCVDSLAVVDTMAVCTPERIRWWVGQVKEAWRGPLEVHAHNDFGLGTATTIAALAAGVEVAHVTVNGIGERVGNTPLEHVAVALERLYGQTLGLDLSLLRRLSNEVQSRSRVRRADNHPVTGDIIYWVQSGVATQFLLRMRELGVGKALGAIPPESVGHEPESRVLLGKLSGSPNIAHWAKQLGLQMDEREANEVLEQVKTVSAKEKRLIEPEELRSMLACVRNRG